MVGELLIGDCAIEVEVIVVNSHEFDLLSIVLLHHNAIDCIRLFCDAHLRPFLEESTGSGVPEGEVGTTKLKITPNLEIL